MSGTKVFILMDWTHFWSRTTISGKVGGRFMLYLELKLKKSLLRVAVHCLYFLQRKIFDLLGGQELILASNVHSLAQYVHLAINVLCFFKFSRPIVSEMSSCRN